MWLQILLFLAIVSIVITIRLTWRLGLKWAILSWRARTMLKGLAEPVRYPLLFSAFNLKWDIIEFSFQAEKIIRHVVDKDPHQFGIIQAWIGPVPAVVIARSRHVKRLLESSANIDKPFIYNKLVEWLGEGLLTSHGDKWHTRRRIITPTFHFSILKGYQEVFVVQGRILTEQLETVADTGREVDIFPFIKRCALDIICETAMGTQLNCQTGGNVKYVKAVVKISSLMGEYIRMPWLWLKPIWYASGRGFVFNELVKITREFTMKIIQERRRMLEEEGLLGGKSDQQDNASKKSVFIDKLLLLNELNNDDIREEVDTFMFEGHDTTASAMGFTIWFLGQYPECQKVLHDEIDNVFGEDRDRDPTEEDLRRLPYLERCIMEALRLMPSVPGIARVLSEDLEIDGVTLPKDLYVGIAPIITQRDPDNWEFPEDFYPDHFLPEKVAARDPFAFVPFSAGPRNCVGQKFAIAEEKTVLSWFFRRYSVETIEPYPGNRPIPEMLSLLTLSALVASASAGLLGFTQSAAVRGVLMCHDKPAAHVLVKLYDDDAGVDLDDLMDSGESDADGRFSLAGSESEFMTIDPKVNIYHDCDDNFAPCQRRITIFLPKKYVTQGSTPEKVYDAGVIQLSGKYAGETRDCLHRV